METFLIGFLSVAIVSLMYFTLGGKNTLYVFVAISILGVLIGIFEDIDFSSSEDERTEAYSELIISNEPCINTLAFTSTKIVDGISYQVIADRLYRSGTPADNRTISAGDDEYRVPKDPVCRCALFEALEKEYGITIAGNSVKGKKISATYEGKKYEVNMPEGKGRRCIAFAELQNTFDGLYKYGRPEDSL